MIQRFILCKFFILVGCFFNTIYGQELSSGEILKSLYDNFETSTEEEQYNTLLDLRRTAKNEKNDYNYNFALTNLSTYAFVANNKVAFTQYAEEALQHWESGVDLNRERIFYTGDQAITLESFKGNPKRVIELYFTMLSDLKKDTTSTEFLTEIYSRLSSDFRSFGDLESARIYNDKVIDLIEKNHKNDKQKDFLLGDIECTQAHIYRDQDELQNAIKYYKNSILHLDKVKDEFNQLNKNKILIESYIGMAKTFLKTGDIDQVDQALSQAEKIQKKTDFQIYQTLEIRGQSALDQKLYAKGQALLDSALQQTKKSKLENSKFPKEARITMRMGNGKYSVGDLESALGHYQDALKFIDNAVQGDLLSNPLVENIIHTKQALEILHKKAKVSAELIKKDDKVKYFNIASNAYKSAINLLDKMKVDFLNQDTRYFIASNASLVYNDYIELLADQFYEEEDDELISTIYAVSEKNKSTIAFEELKYKYKLANSKIPNDLKQKHKELKLNILYLEKMLSDLDSSKSEDIEKIKNKIFSQNEAYVALDQKLNREYSDQLNKRDLLLSYPTMKEIQTELNREDLIIEVFESEDQYYFIAFSNSKYYLHRVPNKDINVLLKEYLERLSVRPTNPHGEDLQFVSLSNKIYKQLYEPVLNQFENVERIFLVPDGLLSSIPFEGLITDKSDAGSFAILNYNIAYLYATVQVMQESNILNEVSVLSLAPQFGKSYGNFRTCDRDSLSSLPYAKKESEFLSELYSGSFLNSGVVNKSDLMDNINSHQIIHIASHACLNESDPMLNEIHFSDSYLTNKEIESQLASPELIVLGACNTANGKYIEGEGLLSLSKGFLQAGAKCIQSSLWSIDDYASSEIIKNMFANLKTGVTKSEALRSSKLQYLENEDGLRKHPYYWAGIIQTGNDSALFQKDYSFFSKKGMFYILGIILLLAMALFLKRKIS